MAVQAQLYAKNLGFHMVGSLDWAMNPVLGFGDDVCFGAPLLQRTLPHQCQWIQNLGMDNDLGASTASGNQFLSVACSQSLGAQLEKQRQEIDLFLQLQTERLRSTLRDQRNQELATLLQSFESEAMNIMRQKDEDLAEATKRAMEFQDRLRIIEMENETWQRIARENEVTVINLNNMLKRVKERVCSFSNGAEDAESFCESSDRSEDIKDQLGGDREVVKEHSKKMACKLCDARSSCVVFLPCKHLCSCKSCEAFLGLCPVCKSLKEASMEVFLV